MASRVISNIKLQLSKEKKQARADAKEFLGNTSSKGKESIKRIVRQVIPTLDRGMYLSQNSSFQEINILEKKEKLAKNLNDMSKKLLERCRKRKKNIDEQIKSIKKKMDEDSLTELTEEEKLILDEEKVIKHLEDESRIISLSFAEKREHDIKPLLLKVNHISKIIYFEEKAAAVNPKILKQFMLYEDSILKKIEKKEKDKDILDEFKTIQHLISNLKKEEKLLLKEYDKTRKRKEKKHIKKRVNEVIAETLMLENILHMINIDAMIERKFRNNSKKIYKLLEWVRKVEHEEEKALNRS